MTCSAPLSLPHTLSSEVLSIILMCNFNDVEEKTQRERETETASEGDCCQLQCGSGYSRVPALVQAEQSEYPSASKHSHTYVIGSPFKLIPRISAIDTARKSGLMYKQFVAAA